MSTGLRKVVESFSGPLLVRLTNMPRAALPIILIVLLFSGFYFEGIVGGLLLSAVDVFIAWLVYLSWPVDTPKKRFIRVFVLLVLVTLTVSQFVK